MKSTKKKYKAWEPVNIYPSATIGEGCNIGTFAEIGDKVKIGKRCKIGGHAFIPEGVTVEDEVFIGPHVMFCNDKKPRAVGNWVLSPTKVCRGASVGANSTILPGITIGKYAMVGAGSVVTKDVGEYKTVCGNPAGELQQPADLEL